MNGHLASVLRVTPEPYSHLDDMQIHHLLTRHPQQYMDYIRSRLEDIAKGHASLNYQNKVELRPNGKFEDFISLVNDRCANN